MKVLTSGIIVLASAGLLLGACSKEAKTIDSANTNSVTPPAATTSPVVTTVPKAIISVGGKSNNGGKVVESGQYHLEFVPEQGSSETHLDLYLQKGDTHEPIATAKVTADVQLPDGQQKTIPFSYDVKGKHYAAVLNETISGQYQVKITAKIGNEKADGRFNFNR